MDKLIYTAMTGAKYALSRQDTHAQNLAHASTPGYRAETAAYRAVPLEGSPTRVFVLDASTGADLSPGPVKQTGRSLDIALTGAGWIAIEGSDGREAYTRNGSLQVSAAGILTTDGGLPVLGDGGPLAVPPDAAIRIASDGTVSVIPSANPGAVQNAGRIKLVNPAAGEVVKGADGMFRTRNGAPAQVDESVRLSPGALEGSNVNVVESLVGMIALSRQFDLHMKLLQNAETNARESQRLLSISG